jgi:hypothetical protein
MIHGFKSSFEVDTRKLGCFYSVLGVYKNASLSLGLSTAFKGLHGAGFDPRQRQRIFPLTSASGPIPPLTQKRLCGA